MKSLPFLILYLCLPILTLAQATSPSTIIPTGNPIGVSYVEISPDGKYLLSCSSSDALVWEISSGKPLYSYKVPSKLPGEMARFSPDGKKLLTGSISPSGPGVIANQWDLLSKEVITEFRSTKSYGSILCYSADGALIGTTGVNGKIEIWDAATAERKYSLQVGLGVKDLMIMPDGKSVFFCYEGAEIWDLASGKKIASMQAGKAYDTYQHACITSDGLYAAVSNGQNVTVFKGGSYDFYREFKGHKRHVTSMAFSSDNHTLASGSTDGTLKLWDATSGRKLFDISMGIPLSEDELDDISLNFKGAAGFVNAVCFSPDGKTIYAGLGNREIRAYDVATGQLEQTFAGTEMTMEYIFVDEAKHLIYLRHKATTEVKIFNYETLSIKNMPPDDGIKWEHFGVKGPDRFYSIVSSQSLRIYDKTDKFLGAFYFLGDKDWYFFNKERSFDCSPGAYNYIFYLDGLLPKKITSADPRHKSGIVAQLFKKQ